MMGPFRVTASQAARVFPVGEPPQTTTRRVSAACGLSTAGPAGVAQMTVLGTRPTAQREAKVSRC